jgi:hypothetical protein
LPPIPRHPAPHVPEDMSQIRSDVGPPQSLSMAQPHVSLPRHALPVEDALQFLLFIDVHCTQWFLPSQTCGMPLAIGQSESLMHCTQTCG